MPAVPRISVDQAPSSGERYPFADSGTLTGVVLDAYLSYVDNNRERRYPFTLTIVDALEASFTATVTDADLVEIISVAESAARVILWGSRTVYQWVVGETVLRLVVRRDLLTADGSGELIARTYSRVPARVRAIKVEGFELTGPVQFVAGYNLAMAATTGTRIDGTPFVNSIDMDAVPGAGEGRLAGCDEALPVVRRINQVGPDDSGNFIIEADDCFRVQFPLIVTDEDGVRTAEYGANDLSAEQAVHALRVTSDCRPCCDCDYYVRTYRGVKRMWDRWKETAGQLESTRDLYAANRTRWTAYRDCLLASPARLVTGGEKNCRSFIGGSLCNFTRCCIGPVEIRFTFTKFRDGVAVEWPGATVVEATIEGSSTDGEETYSPVVSGPVYRFLFDSADPQATSIAKLRLCVACELNDSLEVCMTAHAEMAGTDVSGNDCSLPEAEVPAEVLAIWAAASVDAEPTTRAVLTEAVPLDDRKPQFNCGC